MIQFQFGIFHHHLVLGLLSLQMPLCYIKKLISHDKITRRSRVTPEIEERRRKQQKFFDEHFNKDHISLELLEDFPSWLDNFGLKSLAPYFKDKKWQDIIEMNSEDLNNLGIRTQKIQNFLLINFWHVRDYIASQKGTKLQPSKQLEMLINRKEFYENNYDKTINYELLENFPMWLEGLGLKHLTRYFEGKRWEEIIEMDWQALDVLGIESRLIRGKLVSHFWKIKRDIAAKKGITLPGKGESRKRELTVEEKEIVAQREKLYKDNYINNINYKLLEGSIITYI
ncbi:hypothetical protein C2G38_1781713 [Gigaspora rosea]|uniref:SAM domain-containing protein n=1 Tax=Gigaspora rosea TaxID=44941 RepID=A0A397UUH7_9GLOM|nr:hypothetical protein C2G38_1781713 [Gigaspora rosea]